MYHIQISGEKVGTWQFVSGNEYTYIEASAQIQILIREYPGRAFRIVAVPQREPVDETATRSLFASL